MSRQVPYRGLSMCKLDSKRSKRMLLQDLMSDVGGLLCEVEAQKVTRVWFGAA